MDIDQASPLLGGLSPARFMRRHWGKRPLLVRQAWPDVRPPLARAPLFELAGSDDVESRLVARAGRSWSVRHGPFARRSLPPVGQPGWTLLLQGLDLHVPAARAMLDPFRFVPEARLDDLMLSWASDGGGVGPHIDAYDVFLIQVVGRRRWRVGRVDDPRWRPGLPLRILRRFVPEFDWVLEPGDLLYLPPLWGHDGIAVGECMTASVGFRTPAAADLVGDLLQRLADVDPDAPRELYLDPHQPATRHPAAVPQALQRFARRALTRRVGEGDALARVLGEALTEPKPRVWFEPVSSAATAGAVELDRRSRMMYDERHLYLNGESYRAGGRDAAVLRRLADARSLSAADRAKLSRAAHAIVAEWLAAGWLHESGVA